MPSFLWGFARATNDSIRRLPELPAAYLHPWRRESIRRLAALKDIHKGKRAFVIANGPSLKQTDMSKLRNEFTFGMNRIYLMFPELGFSTTYLTVVNDLVIEQTADVEHVDGLHRCQLILNRTVLAGIDPVASQ